MSNSITISETAFKLENSSSMYKYDLRYSHDRTGSHEFGESIDVGTSVVALKTGSLSNIHYLVGLNESYTSSIDLFTDSGATKLVARIAADGVPLILPWSGSGSFWVKSNDANGKFTYNCGER